MTEEEILKQFAEAMLGNMHQFPEEYNEIFEKHFWEILA